jgi:hypothetical protein
MVGARSWIEMPSTSTPGSKSGPAATRMPVVSAAEWGEVDDRAGERLAVDQDLRRRAVAAHPRP